MNEREDQAINGCDEMAGSQEEWKIITAQPKDCLTNFL
jgi:hypothetical protein